MLDEGQIEKIAGKVADRIKTGGGTSHTFPVGVSGRHLHISRAHLDLLFGPGYELKVMKDLRQPGQFAAQETVVVAGPKGCLEKVRILGPVRPETQVEVSLTDAIGLGVGCPVRNSGDLSQTPGVALIGPKGMVALPAGTIVAARHLHVEPERAEALGLKDKQIVRVTLRGAREVVFGNVLVRTGKGHMSEFHLDTDEANAAGVRSGDEALIEF